MPLPRSGAAPILRRGPAGDWFGSSRRCAMPWWTWIAAGALLLVAEAVLPTDFFLVFFGAAGLVVGLAMLLGLHLPAWAQWLLFAALTIVSLVVLRPRLRRALGK